MNFYDTCALLNMQEDAFSAWPVLYLQHHSA